MFITENDPFLDPKHIQTKILDFDATVFEPKGKHTATIIWLHGLGDTGRGMVRAVSFVREELGKLARNVRFVMPHA
ncbi:hypothetical protein D9611_000461 [Ephemerocybe angulata]|uniref:Phospholipase/carboxylesterase/thioesterase domain-containing protein n=1 Tax=Ephemerocybe angulata TaxID=980116 RepID=A0A8H5BM44_9AGAR|nr:hypothetical protein D9611_000461 [Tulosesus angulatus]